MRIPEDEGSNPFDRTMPMNLSEAIERMQELKTEYGDLEIRPIGMPNDQAFEVETSEGPIWFYGRQ